MKLLICGNGYDIGSEKDNNKIIINDFLGKEEYVLEKDQLIENIDITVKGKNNNIYINADNQFRNTIIRINGDDNHVVIKKSKYSNSYELNLPSFNNIPSNGRKVVIGKDSYIGSAYMLCALSGEKLLIGDQSFLSSNIHVRTSDAHAIINCVDNKIINSGDNSIEIGNHCWLGEGAFVNKGVKLANDIIVGARSVVTGSFKEHNIMIAGIPARKIKGNVKWVNENTEAAERNYYSC